MPEQRLLGSRPRPHRGRVDHSVGNGFLPGALTSAALGLGLVEGECSVSGWNVLEYH